VRSSFGGSFEKMSDTIRSEEYLSRAPPSVTLSMVLIDS
jgi:hypothetical protein